KQVEHGLKKLTRILGDNFESKVILAMQKSRCKAEITVSTRVQPVVGIAESTEMTSAVGEALEHIEKQVVKHRTRWRNIKRQPRKKWVGEVHTAEIQSQNQQMRMAVGANAATAVPVVVHSYPATVRMTEAHIVPSTDSVSMRPMTLEEAVKEAEFRDRDVFVFRDAQGRVKVLHRKKDGKMELIEAP
ncbi:MAG TPA: HPF/RaiA family ribosome-associated protein, partial [Terriglobales bacterium]|nr:HPF/RaiA family ribosome-associated protein [Terriglobales bacterium]